MKGMVDPDYRKFFEDTSPDGIQEVLDGAKAFFTTDQPAVQAWKFSAAQAARITQPVLLSDWGRERARQSDPIAGAALPACVAS